MKKDLKASKPLLGVSGSSSSGTNVNYGRGYPHVYKASIFFFAFFLLYFYISPMYKCETPLCIPHHHLFWEEATPGYLVYTSSCKISEMNPFDRAVRPYIRKRGPQRCPRFLIKVSNQLLKYDASHPKYKKTSCCFKEIHRISQDPAKYDKNADWQINISSTCHQISKITGTNMTSEFVKIECEEIENGKILKSADYQATVFPPEKQSNSTKTKLEYWQQDKFSLTPGEMVKQEIPGRPPSVLIVGIDSISRMHMFRSLPKTKLFLEENDFIEMKGYTKIGENTFPNIMGVLAGMELNKYPCWKGNKDKIDNCPLIWKNFSSSNYITAFMEDSPGLAIFNYIKTGFVEQPTDYYLRPLAVAYHGKLDHSRGYSGCVAGLSQTDFMLNYMRNFVERMGEEKIPYFLMSWFTSLAHDDFNALKPADTKYYDLLSDAVNDASYNGNNTIILFISDHGYRFGSFRETFLGYYEESLPFFYVRMPPALKLSHPHWYENLRMNSHRLTSPLDFHATLEDILSLSFPSSPEKPFPFTHSNWDTSSRKVYSFFEETPLNRTCESSGIPQLYCRCGVTPAVSKKSKNSEKFGELVVRTVNLLLHETIANGTCIPLKFSKFLYLRELGEGELWNNFGKLITFKDHIVALEAIPSSAHFEAKVRVFSNDTMTIIGEVSRINSYQGQNDCLKDYTLKNYCMCKDYFEAQQLAKRTNEAKKKKKAEDEKKRSTRKKFHKATEVSVKTSVSVVTTNSSVGSSVTIIPPSLNSSFSS